LGTWSVKSIVKLTHYRHAGESRHPGGEEGLRWIAGLRLLAAGNARGTRAQRAEMKQPCVYILASKRNGTLYTGVTADLVQRVWQHKNGVVEGFTKRYRVHTLVWFEIHETMVSAIAREKAIKEWERAWKIELIEKSNPTWRDLYGEIV
jgi:putative endonuclease